MTKSAFQHKASDEFIPMSLNSCADKKHAWVILACRGPVAVRVADTQSYGIYLQRGKGVRIQHAIFTAGVTQMHSRIPLRCFSCIYWCDFQNCTHFPPLCYLRRDKLSQGKHPGSPKSTFQQWAGTRVLDLKTIGFRSAGLNPQSVCTPRTAEKS